MNSWDKFWQAVSVYDAFLWAALIVGGIVILFANWKKIVKIVLTIQQVITLTDDISYIRSQLENNGGSTVKDAVQKAVSTTEKNCAEIAKLHTLVTVTGEAAAAAYKVAAETRSILMKHLVDEDVLTIEETRKEEL